MSQFFFTAVSPAHDFRGKHSSDTRSSPSSAVSSGSDMFSHKANLFFSFTTDFEASFIRLLDKITNGSRIEINQTGKLLFCPI